MAGKRRDMARPVDRRSPTALEEAFAVGGAADAGSQIRGGAGRKNNVMASCLLRENAYLKLRTTKTLCAVYQDNDLVEATVTTVAKKKKKRNRKRNTKQEVGWNLELEAGTECKKGYRLPCCCFKSPLIIKRKHTHTRKSGRS